ncbi:class I SAM-dependent methyltransferase [Bacillus sp. 2205SS5-2]|uniref:class I SAM-dependent methyltransferase n=1 Tax=Bacillus sp. 2205SS5-2 TaxID=3109031 RepID=UPI003006CA22
MKIDFGKVAQPYLKSRDDIPNNFFESLALRGIQFKGKRIADIGAGTGVLTRKIHKRGGEVVGIEPSTLIDVAQQLNEKYLTSVPYRKEYAEQTSLQDQECDLVTVFRAWHWFDREKTIKEVDRILKNHGVMIVGDSGFSLTHPLVQETLSFLQKRSTVKAPGSKAESKQRINGFPVEWFTEWEDGGFDIIEMYKKQYEVSFTIDQWCDRIESISWLAEEKADRRQEVMNELKEHLIHTYAMQELVTIPHTYQLVILKKLKK